MEVSFFFSLSHTHTHTLRKQLCSYMQMVCVCGNCQTVVPYFFSLLQYIRPSILLRSVREKGRKSTFQDFPRPVDGSKLQTCRFRARLGVRKREEMGGRKDDTLEWRNIFVDRRCSCAQGSLGGGAMPIIFHLPKKNSALVHIRNVVRHRMVFPSFRSHVFSCVGAVRIQKKLPTNYNNMSVLMYLKFRFPKIGINCITFKMAIVSNKLKMAHRSHLISPPPLFFLHFFRVY